MSGSVHVRPIGGEHIASCNACLARNYDTTIATGTRERVYTLY